MKDKKEIQVIHPSHYNTRSYECWDVFKEIAEQNNMSPAESALFFNVFKSTKGAFSVLTISYDFMIIIFYYFFYFFFVLTTSDMKFLFPLKVQD